MSGDPEYLVAVHDFKGRSDDEVSLKKGDQILVLENDKGFGDGWYIGRNLSSNKAGLFPRVFTTHLVLPTPPAPLAGASNPTSPITPTSNFQQPSNMLSTATRATSTQQSQQQQHPLYNTTQANNSVTDTLTDIDEAIHEINNSRTDLSDSNGGTPVSLPTQQVHQNIRASQVEQTPEIFSYSNVQSWTPSMVQQYFLSRGYDPHVCQCFLNHKITGNILLELDLAYLKEIDITSFGTRFEISKEIKQLNQLARNSAGSQSTNGFSQNKSFPVTPVSTNGGSPAASTAATSMPPPTSPTNNLMSPPQFKRQSMLRSTKENSAFNNYTPGQRDSQADFNEHKKGPSFDPNWVHPATLKKQEQERQHRTNSTRLSNIKDQGSDNFQTPKPQKGGRIRSSTISTTDQYFNDNQESPDRPAMPPPLVIPTQNPLPYKQKFVEATQRQLQTHSRQGSKDTIRGLDLANDDNSTATKHAQHSSSSLGLEEFKFISKIDSTVEDFTTERPSSLPSVNNPLPVPEKDTPTEEAFPVPPEKDAKYPIPLEKELPVQPNGDIKEGGKRVSTDPTLVRSSTPESSESKPKRSSTSAGQKKKSKPVLRSSSSQSNLRSKNTFSSSKQKTSAFTEGINSVSPAEAAKTASYSGWMNKRGTVAVGTWKARFFCLHGTRLSYFTSFNDTNEKGLIDLTSHRVVAVGDSDDKFVALYAASVGAGRYCFKVVPPAAGTRKGVTFTMPKVHYFAVDTKEEMRSWMTAILKATIDRDDTVPVISSCATPTVPLAKAHELLAEARAKEEVNRTKAMASNDNTMFGGQINSSWLNGFGQYGEGPSTPDPDSPTASSVKSAETGSTNTAGSSLAKISQQTTTTDEYFNHEPFTPTSAGSPNVRALTTKTAGLRLNTDLNGTAP